MPIPKDNQDHESLLEKYERATVKSGWCSYFVGAALRLASWSTSIELNQNLDISIDREEMGGKTAQWKWLLPSVNYLLDSALNINMDTTVSHLMDLNNDLLVENGQFLESQRDENALVREIYAMQRHNIY